MERAHSTGTLACLPDELIEVVAARLHRPPDTRAILRLNRFWHALVRDNEDLWRQMALTTVEALRCYAKRSQVPPASWRSVCRQHFQLAKCLPSSKVPEPIRVSRHDLQLVQAGTSVGGGTPPTLSDFVFTVRLFDGSNHNELLLTWVGAFTNLHELQAETYPGALRGRGCDGFRLCEPGHAPEALQLAWNDEEETEATQKFWDHLRLEIEMTHEWHTFKLLSSSLFSELSFHGQLVCARTDHMFDDDSILSEHIGVYAMLPNMPYHITMQEAGLLLALDFFTSSYNEPIQDEAVVAALLQLLWLRHRDDQ